MVAINPLEADQQLPTVAALLVPMAIARAFSLSRVLLRDGLDIDSLLATVIGRDVEGHLLLLL